MFRLTIVPLAKLGIRPCSCSSVRVVRATASRGRLSRRAMSDRAAPARFAEGSNPAVLAEQLAPLLARPAEGRGGEGQGRWTLTPSGEGLERTFRFKTFAKTWDFMTAVSLQCKIKNHHPEWSNVYNTVFIRWTTHVPRGLSSRDLAMAAACDDLAAQFGELPPSPPSSSSSLAPGAGESSAGPGKEGDGEVGGGGGGECRLQGLADRAVGAAPEDCCVPKGKGAGKKAASP